MDEYLKIWKVIPENKHNYYDIMEICENKFKMFYNSENKENTNEAIAKIINETVIEILEKDDYSKEELIGMLKQALDARLNKFFVELDEF